MPFGLEEALLGLASDPFKAHEVVFPHKFPSAPFHKEMIELYWGAEEKVAMLCFRGSAKSTRAEESIILQALFGRFRYAVIVGANEDRACDRLLAIKFQLETNPTIEALFGPQRGDCWQSTRIILRNGVCLDALGAGQSLRGLKYLNDRPQFALIDDLEELSRYLDNVSTPEKRAELARWTYGSLLPALAEPSPKVRMAGTTLHEESLIATVSRSKDWKSLTVPIEYKGPAGERIAAWPSKYSLEWIDQKRSEYGEANQLETFGQEFLCRSTAPEARSFRAEHFRFEDRVHTWEPVFVIYDPARTVGPKSCSTGKIAASWVNSKLLVWEASANFWQPNELINDVFEADDLYTPIAIGIEKTGLSAWLEDPLRDSQMRRGHPIPYRGLEPPRGPGKERFIEGLQSYFASGQVVFCGPRQSFDALIKELLGFPHGRRDTANALAYMLEIKPGVPIYENFCRENICEDIDHTRGEKYLLLNSDSRSTCGVLVCTQGGSLSVVADWLEPGDPGAVLGGICSSARLVAGGKFTCYAGAQHFQLYDTIGLRAAATACGMQLMRGGDIVAGRGELRRLLTLIRGDKPLLQVSKEATWTLRALSGGYSRDPGKPEVKEGAYKVLGECLETFAAVLAQGLDDGDGVRYGQTKDGRKFLSSAGWK